MYYTYIEGGRDVLLSRLASLRGIPAREVQDFIRPDIRELVQQQMQNTVYDISYLCSTCTKESLKSMNMKIEQLTSFRNVTAFANESGGFENCSDKVYKAIAVIYKAIDESLGCADKMCKVLYDYILYTIHHTSHYM